MPRKLPHDATFHFSHYTDSGNLAVQIQTENSRGYRVPFTTLSVNVEDVELAPGEFVCKNWSENEGLDNIELYGGRFEDTGRRVDVSQFCKDVPVWRVGNPSLVK